MSITRVRTQRVEGTDRYVVVARRDGVTVILSTGKGTDMATAHRHAQAYAKHYGVPYGAN